MGAIAGVRASGARTSFREERIRGAVAPACRTAASLGGTKAASRAASPGAPNALAFAAAVRLLARGARAR